MDNRDQKEKELIELFNNMNPYDKENLLEYARRITNREFEFSRDTGDKDMVKIAEFCDIEVYMDSNFSGAPSVELNYLDEDITGSIDLDKGEVEGDFSKYVVPVIEAWYQDNKNLLRSMWESRQIEIVPAWE